MPLFWVCAQRALATDVVPAAPLTLRLVADRDGAVYACGEAARITVMAEQNGKPAAAGIDRGHGMGLPAFTVQCDTVWLPEALGLQAVP